MPSTARTHQLTNSLLYHVYNRGNARIEIFHDSQDYEYFIKILLRYLSKKNLCIYHWVLMPNHYHLLIEIDAPERISSVMAGVARAYVHYYHKKYHTSGHLWQGRFKSQPVEKDQYMLTCGRYIERNPVKAGMVTNAQEYAYSSAKCYVEGLKDNLTQESPLYETFGNTSIERREKYKEYLRTYDAEEEEAFEDLEHPQGSEEFKRKLVKDKGLYLPRKRGRMRSELMYKNF